MENIDYKGEISDDEDTIINYGENDEKSNTKFNINNSNINEKDNNMNLNEENEKRTITINNNQQNSSSRIRIINSNEVLTSEKSENIHFTRNINKRINKRNNSDLFNDRPDIFNYRKIQKYSSNSSFNINSNKQKEDINHSFINAKNKIKLFDSSSLINEDEQK